jgi:N-acetylmuramoyl-L-alanine amidase
LTIRLFRRTINPRPSAVVAAAILVLLFVSADRLGGQNPSPTPLTLLARDGRRAIGLTLVNGQEFVSLNELAAVFQLAIREEARGALTVSYRGRTVVLRLDQAVASSAGRVVPLPAAPFRANGQWLVPVEFAGTALGLIYNTRLDLRPASHLLVIGDLRVPRVTVRYDATPGGGRLTIDATPGADSLVTATGNERLAIRFEADAIDLAPPLPTAQVSQGVVSGIRADATTLTIDLGPRVTGYRAATEQANASTRLSIELTAPRPAAAPAAAAAGRAAVPPSTPPRAISTIVIDPGHGGEDTGVTGSGGTREKDVALTMAMALKAAIEDRMGVRVLLTREDDRQLSADDRAAFANSSQADLFISLHANASLLAVAAGASVYSAAIDDAAASARGSRAEQLPLSAGGVREIELVAWNRAQTPHLARSAELATLVAQQLRDRVPLLPRAVGRGPFRVLEAARMPAVLIEMCVLTNEDQEHLVGGSEFPYTFAQAVTTAIIMYRDAPAGAPR